MNDKVYVGLTSKSWEKRWQEHCCSAFSKKKKWRFQCAIAAYGKENWRHTILATTTSHIEAEMLEEKFILEYRSFEPEFGYNMTSGGKSFRHSDETKRKISARFKNQPKSISHRKRLSELAKSRTASSETKLKMSETHKRQDVREKQSKLKSRPIAMLNPDRSIIKIFPSVNVAAEETFGDKGCIAAVGRGSRGPDSMHIGYHWLYVDLMEIQK